MTAIQHPTPGRDGYRRGLRTIGLGAMALIIVSVLSGLGLIPSVAVLACADNTPANVSSGILFQDDWSVASRLTDPQITVVLTVTRTPRVPTATPVPTRTAGRPLTLRATPRPAASPSATLEPLSFSFYARATCATRKIQNLTLMITAHGGQPPYDYYDDDVVLAKAEKGSVKYSRDAAAGNPVPYKIIIVDSLGQRYSEDFFFKSRLQCGF